MIEIVLPIPVMKSAFEVGQPDDLPLLLVLFT